MADKGGAGGAEAHARFKQYEYRATASLVLTAEHRGRVTNEPSGESETLWGRIDPKAFGDRVGRTRPPELQEKIDKAKKQRESKIRKAGPGGVAAGEDAAAAARLKRARGGPDAGVLALGEQGSYRPRTRETRAAYEALLAAVQSQFGDQPADVLRGAADEVIAALKSEKRDPEKKKDLEMLLSALSPERFAHLVALGKLITDWSPPSTGPAGDGGGGEERLGEDIGVAVEFDADDDDDAGDGMEVMDDEDGDDDGDGGGELGGGRDLTTAAAAGVAAGRATGSVGVTDIDAYWLQREVARACPGLEPAAAQALAGEVLKTLGDEGSDNRDCENRLVMLLEFGNFELIKKLLGSRLRVVWCTRLARAQDEAEAEAVRAQMAATPETQAILDALQSTRASARERQTAVERSIRDEAMRLRGDGGGGDDAGRGAAAGRHVLELESLAFAGAGRFMANKKCELPEGSFRRADKDYEEVHVPGLKPPPFLERETLRSIDSLPEWARPGFKGMKGLNRVQSRVCDAALLGSDNLLICAPTGAGKTNVAVLTILHEIGLHLRPDGTVDAGAFKVVYIAPMKALVAEMVGNLDARLGKAYGLAVKELTGDISMSRQQIEATQIIVTTPEKWDIITRKSGDRAYTQLVRLVIIDEVHMLHDSRGPVLEAIVARTIRQVEATQEMTRLVGLSATLPNFEDVARFLRVDAAKGLFHFDNSYRPCPLQQLYIGVKIKKPLQRLQLMNELCYTQVLGCAGKHAALVFVHSRKETAKTARFLRDQALQAETLGRFLGNNAASREILATEAETAKNSDLRELLPFGFAIHHAGLTRADRTLVEDLFGDGHVQVLVSTSTLAWGVNLPAHTVIIKGTQVYMPEKGQWDELSPLDVMQMFGRAGRPQFDTFGEGVILTSHAELQYYMSLFNTQLPIESQLISKLADNLNAEAVLGSVSSLNDAVHWLGYTYLYIRMMRNPVLYGISPEALGSDRLLEGRRADLIHSAAMLLDKQGLLRYDRRTGGLAPTDLGRIASHYYVTHGTVSAYSAHLKPHMSDIELCRVFTLSEEFKHVAVREEEKVELAKLLERVPIPVKEGLEDPAAKINVLLQAYVSGLKLEGFALLSDLVYITQSAGRLMRAIFEMLLRRGWAAAAEKALAFCKMIARRMWASQSPLRQFKGVPPEILSKIEKKDLPWERYYDLSAQELGELVRVPKLGKTLHKLVHQFPRLELAAHVQPLTRGLLKVDLTITPDFQWDDAVHGGAEPFWLWVEDADGETLLHYQQFTLRRAAAGEDHHVSFTVPLHDPLPPQYFLRLVSDRWLGCQSLLPISFRHLLLPERNLPPTELLDLQPLPVGALRDPSFEALYATEVAVFNPIQTQAFTCLYNTDDNALVCAPAGSGKTICAEFAVLRAVRAAREACRTRGDPESPLPPTALRVVYVAPLEAIAEERFLDWGHKFGPGPHGLGLSVGMLTGEGASDVKLLERSHITVATAAKWDMLSRRWKQRKAVQGVTLLILDELHLIGGESGPALEVVASRMRYIGAQTSRPARVVGLSHSLANAADLAGWLGVSPSHLYNFAPAVRPVPLEIRVSAIDVADYDARMQAMARPVFAALTAAPVALGAPPGAYAPPAGGALVFVPTRKHARLVALDMLTLASAAGRPKLFLGAAEGSLESSLGQFRENALRHAIGYGVGFLHEGLSPAERAAATRLFESGALSVLVVTAPLCWSLGRLQAPLVAIMGTQYFDGTHSAGADYPVFDLLQMAGRAGRPAGPGQAPRAGGADAARCLLLCHSPRKEFYKKFLHEPLPVESHLDHALNDHMCAEIVTGTVETKQDAVDYLTWTFLYRRLTQNPNYYNLTGSSHRHLSDHLSDLVESVLSDLEKSKCVSVDDLAVAPLNLGLIASYYYISCTTLELFSSSLTAKTKQRGLLEIVCGATEFGELPVRPGEEESVRRLLMHAKLAVEGGRYGDPHVKANALMQAHFGRQKLPTLDMEGDLRSVLPDASRLLLAAVDVISSSGWLNPALAAMELSQMVAQGLWDSDPPLMQLPHVTREVAEACAAAGVESVFDLVALEDSTRVGLLKLTDPQLEDLARFCNRYPNIDLEYEVVGGPAVAAGATVSLAVTLSRELPPGAPETLRPADAPRFPKPKEEGWWIVVCDRPANTLLAIKRVVFGARAKAKLDFPAPSAAGDKQLTLFFMCDSYLGCDQEYEFTLAISGDAPAPMED